MFSSIEHGLIRIQDTTINVIKLHLASKSANEISFEFKISLEETLEIIEKFETIDLK